MASLFDLLRSGQLPQELPPDPWAQLEEIKQRQAQLAQQPTPGIAVTEPRPDAEMIPTRDVAPRPQVGVPYAPMPGVDADGSPPAAQRAASAPVARGDNRPPANPMSALAATVSRGEGIIPDIVKMFTAGSRENQTVRVLMQRGGFDEETATTIARNPKMMQQVLPSLFASKRQVLKQGDVYIDAAGKVIARADPRDTVVPQGADLVRDGVPIHSTPRAPKELSATDKKAIFDAENELPAMNDTLGKLRRARELNSKVYTGLLPKLRGQAGAMMPYPTVEDKATVEWHKMMEPAAIKEMSETLKGASTDREMFKYLELIADASTPPEIRERLIDKAIQLAEHSQKIAKDRMNQLRGGDYYKREGGQSAPGSDAPRIKTFNPRTGRLE